MFPAQCDCRVFQMVQSDRRFRCCTNFGLNLSEAATASGAVTCGWTAYNSSNWMQVVQSDPRVVQLVEDLSLNLSKAADTSGAALPAVLVLNKVSAMLYCNYAKNLNIDKKGKICAVTHFVVDGRL